MTRAAFTARFPNASESCIRANCTDAVTRVALAPVAVAAPPASAPVTPRPKRPRVSKVPRTRNGGTLTEAAFWGMVRSGLRRTFRWWKPALAALHAARVPYRGPRGQKWAYVCCDCKRLFLRKQVQIDHVEPAGQLTSYEHVGEFLRRLCAEPVSAYACRCKRCHQVKTNAERAAS
jgi:hypothetical protein